jgi:outer membrane protein assembly factor BamA
MFATALAVVCAGATFQVQVPTGSRVGRIIIEGNTDTPDHVILEQVPMRPGARFRSADLNAARDGLRRCGYFPVNPWQGVGPTVQLSPNELDSEFVDVRIRVNERPGNWLRYGMSEVLRSGVLGNRVEVTSAVWALFDDGYDRITRTWGRPVVPNP